MQKSLSYNADFYSFYELTATEKLQLENIAESETAIASNATIILTDLQGKIIKTLTVQNNLINYDFTGLPQGVYLAHLLVNGKLDSTLKVMYAK